MGQALRSTQCLSISALSCDLIASLSDVITSLRCMFNSNLCFWAKVVLNKMLECCVDFKSLMKSKESVNFDIPFFKRFSRFVRNIFPLLFFLKQQAHQCFRLSLSSRVQVYTTSNLVRCKKAFLTMDLIVPALTFFFSFITSQRFP